MEPDSKSENFRKLLQFVRPYAPRLSAALGLIVLLAFLEMAPPLITMYIVDEVIVVGRWEMLEVALALLILVPVLAAGLRVVNAFTFSYISSRLIMKVRLTLYEHIFRLSLGYHDEMGTGKVMSRMMGDVATVGQMVSMQMLRVITDFVSVVAAVGICYGLNWKLALLMTVLIPLYVVNYRIFVGPIRVTSRRWRRQMDDVSVGLQERLSGARLVKAYGRERREDRAFAAETREGLSFAMQTQTHRASASAGFWVVSGLRNTLIFCLGCYFVIQGEMTYGAVMAFLSYAMRVFQPILNLMNVGIRFEQMMVSVDRIYEVLDHPIEVRDASRAVDLPPVRGHVVFDRVWFEYNTGEPVLKNICLDVQPGQMVALVGHTGCGKSTLTSLLMRYYDVSEGAITVDGYDIRDVRMTSLRKQVGQVLQDSVLFNASLRENLSYGNSRASERQIIDAAKVGEIHEFAMRTRDGYDSRVGDGGIRLSVGEKQRLAIARAVLTDPAIMILDEATSALDSLSEALIQSAMANVLKGRTSFVIAHRLSTVVNADLILVMDQGEIVERGNHESLMKIPNGKYRDLIKQQFAGSEAMEYGG